MQLKSLEFNWSPIGSWANGNPYTIAFCYPSEGKPYVLKGGDRSIKAILDKTKIPVVVHLTYWWHGNHRGYIRTFGFREDIMIHFWRNNHKKPPRPRRRFCRITVMEKGGIKHDFELRRFPRCFPDQLRGFI